VVNKDSHLVVSTESTNVTGTIKFRFPRGDFRTDNEWHDYRP